MFHSWFSGFLFWFGVFTCLGMVAFVFSVCLMVVARIADEKAARFWEEDVAVRDWEESS